MKSIEAIWYIRIYYLWIAIETCVVITKIYLLAVLGVECVEHRSVVILGQYHCVGVIVSWHVKECGLYESIFLYLLKYRGYSARIFVKVFMIWICPSTYLRYLIRPVFLRFHKAFQEEKYKESSLYNVSDFKFSQIL
jgi:hypothetical protein